MSALRKLLFLVIWLQIISGASLKEIQCESTHRTSWVHVDFVTVCSMGYSAVINTADVTFSPNATITGLDLNLNDEISFLPVKVASSFPNLLGYSAMFCSVKTITKLNFENMSSLKLLWLHGNRIETISADTFSDLTSLEHLDLCEC